MFVRPSAIPSCSERPRWVTRESASTASSSLRSRCASMSMTGLPTGRLHPRVCGLAETFLRIELDAGQHLDHRLARAGPVVEMRRRISAVRDLAADRAENRLAVLASVDHVLG